VDGSPPPSQDATLDQPTGDVTIDDAATPDDGASDASPDASGCDAGPLDATSCGNGGIQGPNVITSTCVQPGQDAGAPPYAGGTNLSSVTVLDCCGFVPKQYNGILYPGNALNPIWESYIEEIGSGRGSEDWTFTITSNPKQPFPNKPVTGKVVCKGWPLTLYSEHGYTTVVTIGDHKVMFTWGAK
jgi:hypothetical protein